MTHDKPHILVAGTLHAAGLAVLRQSGMTFDYVPEISESSYQPYLATADAIVIRTQPLTAASIVLAPRLQVVSRHGVGFDAVDIAALNARRIPLCIVGDVNSVSVAEHAMMLILACAKQLIRADRATRSGDWVWRNSFATGEVAGKGLLILGYGRIGRHLARMADGFGMQVTAFDPHVLEQGWPAGPARPVASLAEGLGAADIVSVNMPKGNGPGLGPAELALMKPGGIVVNTARGGIVDEAALVAALQSGHIAAAGLDVFEAEPPAPDHPLMAFDQVILTPHTAGLTRESAARMAIASVQNVLDHFAGCLNPDLIVNRTALI
ncbi:MAG: hydroxyacid dehydrogenase [Candidatus Saccharibacteria bacterium]|nr:hydroxyacid dehydrogenase [Pseudorhodobacter sp.]